MPSFFNGTPASNLLAALLDFLPEAIALGALLATRDSLGVLLALFIAPQARLSRHWGPPLGAVAGFAVGLIGTLLLEG